MRKALIWIFSIIGVLFIATLAYIIYSCYFDTSLHFTKGMFIEGCYYTYPTDDMVCNYCASYVVLYTDDEDGTEYVRSGYYGEHEPERVEVVDKFVINYRYNKDYYKETRTLHNIDKDYYYDVDLYYQPLHSAAGFDGVVLYYGLRQVWVMDAGGDIRSEP